MLLNMPPMDTMLTLAKIRQSEPSKVCYLHGVPMDFIADSPYLLWRCPVQNCTVRCWGGGTSSPGDDETMAARMEAHKVFDALWESGKHFRSRGEAYSWLSIYTQLPKEDCHIGKFSAHQCRELINHIKTILKLGYTFVSKVQY